MDWLQFWSSILTAWAWPAAVVAVALLFRKQFVGLLEKLDSFEGPGIKASFSEQVVAVGQQVDAQLEVVQQEDLLLKAYPAADMVKKAEHDGLRDRMVNRMEQYRPAAIVIDAWATLERELLKLFAPKTDGQPVFSLAMLEEAEVPSSLLKSIAEMRDLRNEVAHKSGFEPSMLAAERYQRNVARILTVAEAHKALLPVAKQLNMGQR